MAPSNNAELIQQEIVDRVSAEGYQAGLVGKEMKDCPYNTVETELESVVWISGFHRGWKQRRKDQGIKDPVVEDVHKDDLNPFAVI